MPNEVSSRSVGISVGGVTVAAKREGVDWHLRLDAKLKRFFSDGSPDTLFRVHYGKIPRVDLKEPIFRSGAVWSAFKPGERPAFAFYSAVHGQDPVAMALVSDDFTEGDLYLAKDKLKFPSVSGYPIISPFIHPLDQLTSAYLLSLKEGMMVHSCGIAYCGGGRLFVGACGAGKSTTAKMWKKEKGAVILNDDRNVIRKRGSGFSLYGTPWCGEVAACSPEYSDLKCIYFLKQAHSNSVTKLTSIDAATRLIVYAFPPLWNKEGMGRVVRLAGDIAEGVPCYEFGFLPDKSAVDFIKNHHAGR